MAQERDLITAIEVRTMVEQMGLNGQAQGMQFRRELLEQLSPTVFEKFGLSEVLNLNFGGDIPLAVRIAYPELPSKPLLNLDQPRPSDPLYVEWAEHEGKADSGINKVLIASYKAYERKLKRLNVRSRKKRGQSSKGKKLPDFWKITLGEEIADEFEVLSDQVKPGDIALKLFGGYETDTLALLLGRVGKTGRLYYVAHSPYLEEQIFQNLFDIYANLSGMKGDGLEPGVLNLNRSDVRKLVSQSSQREIRSFLLNPYFNDPAFYEDGYSDFDIEEQAKVFFEHFKFTPINQTVPPLPDQISSGSIGVVVAFDRFSRVEEGKKEELLWEIDRVLQPEGRILFRENAREQAAIGYYGQEVFGNGYRHQYLKNLKHPARWILLQKKSTTTVSIASSSGISGSENGYLDGANDGKSKNSKPKTVERMARSIRGVLLSTQTSDVEKVGLSVSWFQKEGYLPLLFTMFEGKVEEAIKYALKEIVQGEAVSIPKGAKSFYTEDDLAQELGISKNAVRKGLRNSGVKILGAVSRSGQSGFTRTAVESRRMQFSYQEYILIKDALAHQDLGSKKDKNKEG